MLKLTKKWKLTKFSAPSAAVCVASVMVNYDLGGGGIPDYRPQNNIRVRTESTVLYSLYLVPYLPQLLSAFQ